jgi:hypothetical protein
VSKHSFENFVLKQPELQLISKWHKWSFSAIQKTLCSWLQTVPTYYVEWNTEYINAKMHSTDSLPLNSYSCQTETVQVQSFLQSQYHTTYLKMLFITIACLWKHIANKNGRNSTCTEHMINMMFEYQCKNLCSNFLFVLILQWWVWRLRPGAASIFMVVTYLPNYMA